ncbi:hypothetical protein [Halarcobacter anaerophilus]|jgi:hypothetical protein|uniref:hypothetical protein n=1 Tax=Halarcobacter anaerophilus TaxID=877500 RepID=UPI0005C844AF|nr:hypothetical protein [Halarcobacter anaerophilus]
MSQSIKNGENKVLNISNILTQKEIKMLQNVGYVLLSGNLVKKVANSQNFRIKKSDSVLFLQLSN